MNSLSHGPARTGPESALSWPLAAPTPSRQWFTRGHLATPAHICGSHSLAVTLVAASGWRPQAWFRSAVEHGPASSLGNFQRATAPSQGGSRGAARFHSPRTGGIRGQVQLQVPCASLPCWAPAAGGLGPPPALCPQAPGGWEGVCPAQDPRTGLLGVGVGPGLRTACLLSPDSAHGGHGERD